MAALGNLGAAMENLYVHAEQRVAMARHVAKMVESGLLPQTALAAIEGATAVAPVQHHSGLPTVVRGRPQGEYVYSHVKSIFPLPKPSMASKFTLGTGQVSMGRARWGVDGASIFSVDDGKRLAQTPVKEATAYERLRANRIAAAEMDTPLVRGMRLLPVLTPQRAFFWGTILAVWATAGTVMSVSRSLGIRRPEDTNEALGGVFVPMVEALRHRGADVRAALADRLPLPSAGSEPSETAKRLRALFAHS